MAITRWGGLRTEPYDPDARDADGDGIVQEGTAWERPAGARLVDKLGRDIRRGITSPTRPDGMKVVDSNGKNVDYKPSYGEAPKPEGKPTPLAGFGYPSLKERGLRSVQDIAAPKPAEPAAAQQQPEPRQPYEEWFDINDVMDWEAVAFVLRRPKIEEEDRDEALQELYIRAMEDWTQWNACRSIRKAAYGLAGIEASPADPNVGRTGGYFGDGWESTRTDKESIEMARYLMAALIADVREGKGPASSGANPTLYRAMDVAAEDQDAFWEAIQVGKTVDVPLMSFADRRAQGPNEFLTQYGKNVLFEVEDAPHSVRMGIFPPMYDDWAERETLDGIRDVISLLESELSDADQDEEFWDRRGDIDVIKITLDDYLDPDKKRDRPKIRKFLQQLVEEHAEMTFRWEGEKIEESDGEYYWPAIEDPESNEARVPFERISGGRFEVVDIQKDPEGVYGTVVRLRQVAAFDPANRQVLLESSGAPYNSSGDTTQLPTIGDEAFGGTPIAPPTRVFESKQQAMDYIKSEHPNIMLDGIDDFNVEALSDIANAADRLKAQYPENWSRMRYLGTQQNPNSVFVALDDTPEDNERFDRGEFHNGRGGLWVDFFDWTDSDAAAHAYTQLAYRTGAGVIGLNPGSTGNETGRGSWNNVTNTYTVRDGTYGSLIMHEFGHIREGLLLRNGLSYGPANTYVGPADSEFPYTNLNMLTSWLLEDYSRPRMGEWGSTYGAKNRREAYAEMFTAREVLRRGRHKDHTQKTVEGMKKMAAVADLFEALMTMPTIDDSPYSKEASSPTLASTERKQQMLNVLNQIDEMFVTYGITERPPGFTKAKKKYESLLNENTSVG